jgi:transcriptional regulator with XRE-family HTH domain
VFIVGIDFEITMYPFRYLRNKKVEKSTQSSYSASVTDEFKEVTAENLRFVRGSKGLTQDEIADLLGLQKSNVSNIENGRRTLSETEKQLLDWYFFGTIPPRMPSSALSAKGVLEFSETEWRIINIFANRAGQTPGKWIASQIRAHLVEASRLGIAAEEEVPKGKSSNSKTA